MADRRKLAIVSGANRGIGKEIARKLAQAGYDVIAGSRNVEEGEAVARAIGARAFPLDVTRRASIDALVESVDRVDVLVNNAGVAMTGFNLEIAKQTIQVNFLGAMHLTDALVPKMTRGARIVNMSSGMGALEAIGEPQRSRLADPELTRDPLVTLMDGFLLDVEAGLHEKRGWPSSAYRVSKAGLNALTRVMARELASDPREIRVNAACPGWVRTSMGGSGAPLSPEEGADTPAWLATEAPEKHTGGFFRDRKSIPF